MHPKSVIDQILKYFEILQRQESPQDAEGRASTAVHDQTTLMCSTKQVVLSFAYMDINKEMSSAQCESPTNSASFPFESLIIIQQHLASVSHKRNVHPAIVNSRLREKLNLCQSTCFEWLSAEFTLSLCSRSPFTVECPHSDVSANSHLDGVELQSRQPSWIADDRQWMGGRTFFPALMRYITPSELANAVT